MKLFKVKVPPFPGFITIVSGSFDELTKELERRGFDNFDDRMLEPGDYAMTLKIDTAKGTAVAILLLSDAPDLSIWHECLHAAWYILSAFGVQIDVSNHEILAYSQGYLYEQIKKRL